MRASSLKTLLALGAVIGVVAGLLFTANGVLAVDTGFSDTAKEALSNADFSQISSPDMIAANIIKTALSYVGVVFLLVVIFSGFLWMTAAGNEERVTKAKKMITGGVIGMILIFAAYAVTDFVFTSIGAGAPTDTTPSDARCYEGELAPECPQGEIYDLTTCSCQPEGNGVTSGEASQLDIFQQ